MFTNSVLQWHGWQYLQNNEKTRPWHVGSQQGTRSQKHSSNEGHWDYYDREPLVKRYRPHTNDWMDPFMTILSHHL